MGSLASWLNTTFAGFDMGVFRGMHNLAIAGEEFFTPFFKAVTLIGEKGLIFFAAAIILMLFPKTRRAGVCIFGAVACGALITNIILKDSIMRARPFLEDEELRAFWRSIGSPYEDGYSFPSGHMTAVTAFAMAFFLSFNKKWSWIGFISVPVMAIARMYLIAHYATDVIAGIIVGAISGTVAYFIAKAIFYFLNKKSHLAFCKFCLEFDVKNFFVKNKNKDDYKANLLSADAEKSVTDTDGNLKDEKSINKENELNDREKQTVSKKSLKKRIFSLVLCVVIISGVVTGAIIGIKKYIEYQTIGDGAYQKAIRSRYERVDKTLTQRLNRDILLNTYKNTKITQLKFEEHGNEDVVLNIYTDLVEDNYVSGKIINHTGHTIYKVLIDYYNTLVDAENVNNMISYLDALNEVFENMQFESHSTSPKIDLDLASLGKNAGEKLSELFALDVEKEGVVKQIGFLPYRIEIIDWDYNFESREFAYSYKISGISYCETSFESSEQIENNENLILSSNITSKNIKTYNRNILISSKTFTDLGTRKDTIIQDLKDYVAGVKSDFDIKTTYFEDTDIYNALKDYMNMREGNFDYKKPENVDMSLVK